MNFSRIYITYFIFVDIFFFVVAFENVKLDHRTRRKWITELFYEAKAEFQIDSNVNSECKRDFDLYKLHLRNQSVWAVKSKFFKAYKVCISKYSFIC